MATRRARAATVARAISIREHAQSAMRVLLDNITFIRQSAPLRSVDCTHGAYVCALPRFVSPMGQLFVWCADCGTKFKEEEVTRE